MQMVAWIKSNEKLWNSAPQKGRTSRRSRATADFVCSNCPLVATQSEISLPDKRIVVWNKRVYSFIPGALRSPLDPSHALPIMLVSLAYSRGLSGRPLDSFGRSSLMKLTCIATQKIRNSAPQRKGTAKGSRGRPQSPLDARFKSSSKGRACRMEQASKESNFQRAFRSPSGLLRACSLR